MATASDRTRSAARNVLRRIPAGAGALAGRARAFLSRLASGVTARNLGAQSKGVRQRFGAGGPTATQRRTIENRGLASPIGGFGRGGGGNE